MVSIMVVECGAAREKGRKRCLNYRNEVNPQLITYKTRYNDPI